MSVAGQNVGQAREDDVKWRLRPQSEQDHAGMRPMIDEDQSPEMAVVRDKDAVIALGDCQDFGIGETGRVVNRDRGDIVPHSPQVRNDAEIRALVQQKPHTFAGT